jgi:oxygen-independent coproporphyrinogen-3 oxidase
MIEHLYLHIPYCHKICPYCSFYKHGFDTASPAALVDSMIAELCSYPKEQFDLKTIYLGGGTPTALTTPLLELLLDSIHSNLELSKLVEFGIEINPRTLNKEKALMLKNKGITRASLGVQSWDPAILKTLGRDHSPAEAIQTYQLLRDTDFQNISIDLMFSIPGQTIQSWESTLQQSIQLAPQHISAYNLNYEEDTPFMLQLNQGIHQLDEDRDATFFHLAHDLLEAAGYHSYEISNYAQPNFESNHNQAYWQGKDYLGIGPSAVSTVNQQRWQNINDTAAYILHSTNPDLRRTEIESLTASALRTERFGIALRTREGLPLHQIYPQEQKILQALIHDQLIIQKSQNIILTQLGKPLVDSIAVALLGDHCI